MQPMVLQLHGRDDYAPSTAREFCDMRVEPFEQTVEQCKKHPRVFEPSLRLRVLGGPFRLRPLRRALRHCLANPRADRLSECRPEDIAHYRKRLAHGVIPGS